MNASIFTLTAIAVDRYKAIIYPLSNHASKQRTKVSVVLILTTKLIQNSNEYLIKFKNNIFISIFLQIILAAIWVGAVTLAIPQAVAFGVMIMDGSIPQCLPININLELFKW